MSAHEQALMLRKLYGAMAQCSDGELVAEINASIMRNGGSFKLAQAQVDEYLAELELVAMKDDIDAEHAGR